MASMGPFPSERIGRDIDDLPIWQDWNSYPCEWNEFYNSKSWNVSPLSFEKIPLSPPPSPNKAKKEVVKKIRSKTSATKRRSSTESISSEKSRKSKDGSTKSKKKRRSSTSSEKVSKPKSDKKKKSKKDRKNSVCSADSSDSTNHESVADYSSSSFRISKTSGELSASFSCLSPSMRSLNDSRSSIMGCDLPGDVVNYIDDLEQTRPKSEPQLNKSSLQAAESKRSSKKAKKKTKKQKAKDQKQQKSPVEEMAAKKKPPSVVKATITMETLPEEVLVSTSSQSKSDHSRSSLRSKSPKRSHTFSKLMVVADGSIRRAVDRKKGTFWEQSARRRGSVRKSIHCALGEITTGIDESIHLFDEDDAKLASDYKTAERSVSTEVTDPWNNSWSISSDSFHDNSERLKTASFLLSKGSPEVEHKEISPF